MNINIKVSCTHTEPEIQRNVKAEFIEELSSSFGAVYRCPKCFREIVVEILEGAE